MKLIEKSSERKTSPAIKRLRGLVLYHQLKYYDAYPILLDAIQQDSSDHEVATALATILLDENRPAEALRLVNSFDKKNGKTNGMRLLRARIHAALDNTDEAIQIYESLRKEKGSDAAQIAMELAPLYARNGDRFKAFRIMREGIEAAPDTFEAYELQSMLKYSGMDRSGMFDISAMVGYQLENDSYNVVFTDTDYSHTINSGDFSYTITEDDYKVALGKGDLRWVYRDGDYKLTSINDTKNYEIKKDQRHVFNGQLKAKLGLNQKLSLTGEANVAKSDQVSYGEYDLLRQSYRLGLGWSARRYGVFLNTRYYNTALDGRFYQDSSSVSPSAFFRPVSSIMLYGFMTYSQNHFEDFISDEERGYLRLSGLNYYESILVNENRTIQNYIADGTISYHSAAEDRSGHRVSAGGLAQWSFLRSRGRLYLLYSSGHDYTLGRNWERDERLFSTQLQFRFLRKFELIGGYQMEKHNYTHLHTAYDKKRSDLIRRWVASLSYRLTKELEVKLESKWTARGSNIEYYSNKQRVIGAGIFWHYN